MQVLWIAKKNHVERYDYNNLINSPPATLQDRKRKKEIEELNIYTMPVMHKKRKINKPVELYVPPDFTVSRKRNLSEIAESNEYTHYSMKKRKAYHWGLFSGIGITIQNLAEVLLKKLFYLQIVGCRFP